MPVLRIVAVNDVYSLENLPRLTTMVRHYATHEPADVFLVTMAGDFLAPSILSSLDKGRGMVDCLNHLPITHAILGNHEDDLEVDELRARLRELRACVLMTNVRGLDDSLPREHVLQVGDVRVGLIGVVDSDPTLYRRAPFGGAVLENANESARAHAARLLAAGCDVVIPITHQRVAEDRALAATTPPFPLILGGHEHDGLIEELGPTVLVKAPAEAEHAAIVELEWSSRSEPPIVRARLEDVDLYAEEPSMRARVDAHMTRVRDLENATLYILPEGQALSSVGTRARQTTMGTLLCSRLRDVLGAEACVFNGGGIRGAREYRGRLTYGDLKTEVPFDNQIVVARLPGSVLADAVRASRARAPAESGGFLQVDDRMVVDERNELLAVDGAPLQHDRIYRVALVRNLFLGMDRVEPLVAFAREHPEAVPSESCGREVKIALLRAFSELLIEQLGGFAAIDADRDGVVTADELVEAIARVANHRPSAVAARVVLEALDGDGDLRLSRREVEEK